MMTIEQAREAARQIDSHVKAIRQLLPGVVRLTDNDRTHSTGRIRAGESVALAAVLDAADINPAAYASLSDRDEGLDAEVFETALLRQRLQVRDVLEGAAMQVQALADDLGDMVLHLGETVKPVTLQAYGIAKAMANTDKKLRAALAPALDYYKDIVKRRRTRAVAEAGAPVAPAK